MVTDLARHLESQILKLTLGETRAALFVCRNAERLKKWQYYVPLQMALKIGRSIQSLSKKVLGLPEALNRFEQPGGYHLPPQQREEDY